MQNKENGWKRGSYSELKIHEIVERHNRPDSEVTWHKKDTAH